MVTVRPKAYPERVWALQDIVFTTLFLKLETRKEQQLKTKKHEIRFIEFHALISVWSG